MKNLEGRVEDWKGHHISNFGALLLDDIFSVTKSEVDREYHVFLFEKIILCCKEYIPQPGNGKKVGKSNSILKKPSSPSTPIGLAGAGPSNKKKNTPLLLKGRIFLNNVTQAVPKINAGWFPRSLLSAGRVSRRHTYQGNTLSLYGGAVMTISSSSLSAAELRST